MKISVITMTYRDPESLKKTAATVLGQTHKDLEYIVVDGGCDEDTAKVIQAIAQKMEKRGGTFRFVSEPDKGLYDALNKGIDMATGDLIGLMCDRFADKEVLSDMADMITMEGSDGIHTDLDYRNETRVVRRWRMGRGRIQSGWMPGHPTLYLKREVYERFGRYRMDYRIAADYEFMARILKEGVILSYLPRVCVHMDHGGDSTSTGSLKTYAASFAEGRRALKQNGYPHPGLTTILRTLRVLAQFVKR